MGEGGGYFFEYNGYLYMNNLSIILTQCTMKFTFQKNPYQMLETAPLKTNMNIICVQHKVILYNYNVATLHNQK